MTIHKERAFEDGICSHLAAHGWLYEPGAAARYDRAHAVFPEDLAAWLQQTQPKAWDSLVKTHGAATLAALTDRLRTALDKQGTLTLLRDGLDVAGLRQRLMLCQFRPALGMNPETQAHYAANRLRVVRQLRYSTGSENSIDLVLFLNGIPVATAELKSDYTQSLADAIDQYRYDRTPKGEPLLGFPGGALVHFAVSNSLVAMCTRLAGADSVFLPFDRGHAHGAGNPPNPDGAPTAYLWEQVWQRDSWLEILGRYLVPMKDDKKRLRAWIFPRFHQLDATRRLVAQVLADGPGGRYLIQHSAGSGKTNSIAWTAHFLADLHDAGHRKLFDTVVVVSDRTVLDRQLREAIEGFERTLGVVATIKGDGASKSQELAAALDGGKKIVVCTIQTFPFAIDEIRRLAATKGKRFAVIADEAHSSQTGGTAGNLKAALSAEEQAEGVGFDTEAVLEAKMSTRAAQDRHISYVAFTATPKAKTLELFGRRPDPGQSAGPGNLPAAFHVYAMRQAIEEGFILDVLRNYTSYKQAFYLTHEGRALSETEVDSSAARKSIMGWVRLHPVNIAARVQIVVEHFRQNVAHLLGGQAKAMVVTSSRKEAVRWMRAMEAYVRERGYGIGLLVAFSGDVDDADTGPEPFTETNMNPKLLGRDIREAFATSDFSILLVANKFQTGFDQPLLCAMYVDRALGGVQAVQTLSRLNRAHPGKDTTYVVDFVNEPEDVLAAFRQYHTTAELGGVSDLNMTLNLRNKLDAQGLYDQHEIGRVVRAVLKPRPAQSDLDAAIGPVSNRLLVRFKQAHRAVREQPAGSRAHQEGKDEEEALLLFKRDLGSYARIYEFLGQMFDYGNTDYEKLYLFAKLLEPLLKYGREREGIDLSALKLTHHRMRDLGQQKLNLAGEEVADPLQPLTDAGSGVAQDKQKQRLEEIIQALNGLFEDDSTAGDTITYFNSLKGKLLESETLKGQAKANSEEQFSGSPSLRNELTTAMMDGIVAYHNMSKQALGSDIVQARLLSLLLGPGELWKALRGQGPAPTWEGA